MPDQNDDLFESERLIDLEPGDNNPLEHDKVLYNPLNHSYPMIADTEVGIIELMVRFVVVRGKKNLPVGLIYASQGLQIPMIIEDIPVSKQLEYVSDDDYDFSGWKSPDDIVAEGALISEMTSDETYYLLPVIDRARRLSSGEGDNADSWEILTKEETAGLISPQAFIDLIVGYASKVKSDPDAPAGLVDILQHFTRGQDSQDQDDQDKEWKWYNESNN